MRNRRWMRRGFDVAAAALALAAACGDDPARPPFDPRIPTAVGSRWDYTGEFIIIHDPDSSQTAIDTFHVDVRTGSSVTVSELTTLADTIPVSVWVDSLVTQEPGEAPRVFTGRSFFEIRAGGLFLRASSNPHLLPKPALRLRVGNRIFAGPLELHAFATGGGRTAAADTIFENPPVLVLRYPLVVGTQWIVRRAGDPWRIEKRVDGIETVRVPAGAFPCYRIRWLHDIDADGQWDEDVRVEDFVSASGMVQREISIDGEWVDWNQQRLGTFTSREWYALTRFTPGPVLP